ncbi:Dihydrofolate reductase [Salinivirga cyanobacteriivorans]|uniref:Dihydrofolate reductase n=1 Tax=Salinivirga cyanobacteriivorans TaxID=1307839 RepID=A0A0S2I0B4_9BACT|nr:dihydrofolate reductase [Salinivirga cyanobacteriivorans]ALO15849.1 Dihydrofolate reductase [Salinivirga cyanobacteriivorans]
MKQKAEIAMIVAADQADGIGEDNNLPWHISADLKRFKALTTGHTIVMGRKTWESLPKKPLPNRKNVVLTRNSNFNAAGATVIHDPEELQNIAKNHDKIFIIGGAEIYRIFYPKARYLYLTRIKDRFECDTYLDFYNPKHWQTTYESNTLTDEKTNMEYQFINLKKKP